MAQDKYLSPKEILKRLCTLESRITRPNNVDYEPALKSVGAEVTEAEVNAEALRMLAFMGMFVYTPRCVFDPTLKPTVGGQIELKGQFSGELKISINPNIRSSRCQVLACLAHELCHKRLEDSRVTFNDRDETEYHTDLCTIFMGFGQLIINGYNVNNNAMGYLKPEGYKNAYDIMQVMRSTVTDSAPPKDLYNMDYFLEETLKAWTSESDKSRLLRSVFMDKGREAAVLAKHTHLLRQVLDIIDSYPRKGLEWLSDAYDLQQNHKNLAEYPIHAFAALYNMEHHLFESELTERVEGINVALLSLMASLERHVPELSGSVLRYDTVVCPFCGAEKQDVEIRGDRRQVRCGACKKYFVIDRSLLDMRDVQEQIVRRGKGLGEGSVNEAYLSGKNAGIAEGRAKAQAETEAALECQRRSLERQYKGMMVEKYQQGLEAARNADAPELKKAVLADVPGWLRWLVSPYLKD